MRPTFARRYRRNRNTSRSEANLFKKEANEPAFFDSPAASPFFSPISPVQQGTVQRKCEKCDEEKKNQKPVEAQKANEQTAPKKEEEKKKDDKMIQRKEANAASQMISSSGSLVGTNGGGTALPAAQNDYFSHAMGFDFSGVKIHTGTAAEHSAQAVNAKAYTLGNNIVFGAGQYQPETADGKRLLAHELAHVAQQGQENQLNRKVAPHDELQDEPRISIVEGTGSKTQNMTNHGKGYCDGVNVQGKTTANYKNSFKGVGTEVAAEGCTGCGKKNCITSTGTVESVFTAAPKVTLPNVPGRLNKCEKEAVKNGINTVLAAHEQDHVNAFNTYVGTESTPYNYTGCKSGLKAHLKAIHDGIEVPRRQAANTESAALDPFNAIFDCDCPPPEPKAAKTK